MRRQGLDYATLAEYLRALAYPVRLELLSTLREPQQLRDIRVAPAKGEGGRGRPAARQTIARHLEKLVQVGLVRSDDHPADGATGRRYGVNPMRLYAFTEDVRRLTSQYAGAGLGDDATGTIATRLPGRAASGPHVVVVHGLYEGRPFALDGQGPWRIGRAPDCQVSLDYDPYVSGHNATLRNDAEGFVLVDEGSKNGTLLNWGPLPPGGEASLHAGDVIGVGRSLLVFRSPVT